MDPADRARPSNERAVPWTTSRPPRPARRARPGAVAVAAAVVVVVLALVATGCVGKRGRNDDVVAPGSDGRPRIEIPTRLGDDPRPRRP